MWINSPKDEINRRYTNWKNGDEALIINDSEEGLNLDIHHAIPICLPTPNTFDEIVDTISVENFVTKKMTEPGHSNHEMEIEIPEKDKCGEFSGKIMNLLDQEVEKLKFSTEDLKIPSRVVILENKDQIVDIETLYLNWEKQSSKDHLAYCYNIKKVGDFGVCETTKTDHISPISKKNVKINFGFCGSSCGTPNMIDIYISPYSEFEKMNRHLWEIKAIYHDDYQKTQDEGFCK